MKLDALEPRVLWSVFWDICRIPHPSHHEAALVAWIVERAKAKGIAVRRDDALNVYLSIPASPGMEKRRGIILQAHTDMVPQANAGIPHDFEHDPIRPRIDPSDPEWLKASGTTLGADNGIGLAAAIALLEDPGFAHGPLEALLTSCEEDGMLGAHAVKPDSLRGEVLINLDNEDDTQLCIGCAGTSRIKAELVFDAHGAPGNAAWFKATVSGLSGGHSGMDIHLGRANAILLLAGIILDALRAVPESRIASLGGGTASNAIPREARAVIVVPKSSIEAWKHAMERAISAARARFADLEPGLDVVFKEEVPPSGSIPDPRRAEGLLRSLVAMPNGALAMSAGMPGLTESSSSLGIFSLGCDERSANAESFHLVRSSVELDKEKITTSLIKAWEAVGASVKRTAQAPAWEPSLSSPLLKLAMGIYCNLNGSDAGISATHGGLECGLLKPVFPRLDMIAIGPSIRFPHSPDEAVNIASVGRFWKFLRSLVEACQGESGRL